MLALQGIDTIRHYCDYIEEHLENVQKAWQIIQKACKSMNFIWDDHLFFTIDKLIKEHDISKLSKEEFISYAMWFFTPLGKEWDSIGNINNETEHKILQKDFESAFENHLRYNSHHWENWTHKTERFPNELSCYCVCMICDWMAMGMKFGDTAEEYYKKNLHQIVLPQWATIFIRKIFVLLQKEE